MIIEVGNLIVYLILAWLVGLLLGIYGTHLMRREEDTPEMEARKKLEEAYLDAKLRGKSE